MVDIKNNITQECLRIEEDATHSSKAHYNAAEMWSNIHYYIGIPLTLFATAAGVDSFSIDAKYAGYLALITAVLAALQTFISASDKSVKHKGSGSEYKSLQNQTRLLREIQIHKMNEDDIVQSLESLVNKRDELNRLSLSIPYRAFKKAKEGIDAGQADYLADKGDK
jgi:hypothetical protein